jgi:hypothetical protein
VQRAVRLKVTTWGSGDPAMFVHGSFGRGEKTWKEQCPLADSHRLVLVDRRFLRAFGLPGRPEELKGAELEGARSSWHERPPWEADIPLHELRGLRMLVVRGDWSDAPPQARELGGATLHAVCDVLERELEADSASLPAAHNPQLLGQAFNECLRSFWEST